MPRHRKRIPRRRSIAGVIVNPAVCCGRDARQSRALFCKHHPPPLGNEPFNDDCGGLNDLSIWVFSSIRAN
jgi:hypothetical protein